MKKEHLSRSKRVEKWSYITVLTSFIIPIGFLIYRLAVPEAENIADVSYRSKADYALMLLQCLLGVIVIHLPSFLQKRFRFELPTALYVMYILFLYCAIFLGEVRSFFYTVPHWDVVLHAFSSVMAGSFGFLVVALLNRDEHTPMELSPFFVALFAFCFAVSIGAVWEIYEFVFDGLLGLNMQKFMLSDGTVLVGHAAIADTMKDIIVDCLGALAASITGYFSLKSGKGWATQAIAQYAQTANTAE